MGHIFLSFLFFNIILINLYGHYKRGNYYIKKSQLVIYIILFILFGTYGGGEGDYLHYKSLVEDFGAFNEVVYSTSFEIQYVFLSYCVGGNYTLWRLILYSIQFVGFGFFLYKARLNTYPVLLSFTALCLVASVYGRTFWGIVYFFLGVYLLIEKKNFYYLIAIALCYLSHMSNLVLIALLPLAFIKIKKWHFLFFLLSFSMIVALFKDSFIGFLNSGGVDADGADYVNSKLQDYGNREAKSYFGASIGMTISVLLRCFFVISILFVVVKLMFKKYDRYLTLYKPVRGIINISFGIILLSSVILSASVGGAPLFYRIFDLALFPVSIILPCLLTSNHVRKMTYDLYIYCFIIYTEYGYIRDLYYAYAEGL